MDLNIINKINLRDLTADELKCFNGGEPNKSTSFIYDAVYSVFYLIGKSEIFTKQFWVEWDEAIS
jgi:hypothetical protein